LSKYIESVYYEFTAGISEPAFEAKGFCLEKALLKSKQMANEKSLIPTDKPPAANHAMLRTNASM